MAMDRRDLLRGGALLPLAMGPLARRVEAADPPPPDQPMPFDNGTVRGIARELASKPYQAPDTKLPEPFSKLSYEQYRAIRFDPARSLWRGKNLPFEVQFFHRGFLYLNRVDLFEVAGGKASPIAFSPDLFDYGELPRPTGEGLGFAGFRIHAPFNRADYFDEVCAFLGASYFRAVGKGQGYGLSARRLGITTGDTSGEEFPIFRAFWLEQPQPRASALVVHALLDGPSAAAAFRFSIRPGEATIFDVESTIYPRSDISQAGLAPL